MSTVMEICILGDRLGDVKANLYISGHQGMHKCVCYLYVVKDVCPIFAHSRT